MRRTIVQASGNVIRDSYEYRGGSFASQLDDAILRGKISAAGDYFVICTSENGRVLHVSKTYKVRDVAQPRLEVVR